MKMYKELEEIQDWQPLIDKIHQFLKLNPDIYNREKNISLIPIPDYFFRQIKTDIDSLFKVYDLKCVRSFLYVMTSNNDGDLHNDNSGTAYRINFPVLNCQNTFTEFYTVSKWNLYTNTKYTIKLPADDALIQLVDRVEITKPTVISVNEFHRIVMDENNSPRITLSLMFDKNLKFLID